MEEEGSAEARRAWLAADRMASSRVLYPEARAALSRATRTARIDFDKAQEIRRRVERQYEAIVIIDLDESLARLAGDLAERHGLRGFDAVHLASASSAQETLGEVTLVTWDADLARAARRDGLPVVGG